METFIKDFIEGKEVKVKVAVDIESTVPDRDSFEDVPNDRPKVIIMYYLTSKYDEKAEEGWIEVEPVLSCYKQSQDNPISVWKIYMLAKKCSQYQEHKGQNH